MFGLREPLLVGDIVGLEAPPVNEGEAIPGPRTELTELILVDREVGWEGPCLLVGLGHEG